MPGRRSRLVFPCKYILSKHLRVAESLCDHGATALIDHIMLCKDNMSGMQSSDRSDGRSLRQVPLSGSPKMTLRIPLIPKKDRRTTMNATRPPLTSRLMRYLRGTILCLPGLIVGAALVGAQESRMPVPSTQPMVPDPRKSDQENQYLLRQGTDLVDQVGEFRLAGDRVVFFMDGGKRRLIGLENLTLERITQTLIKNPERLQWRVTGTITEYQGNNFLFITHAILKSRVETGGILPLP